MKETSYYLWPEFVTRHFYRPLNAQVNLDRMRKDAASHQTVGHYAILHHHPAEEPCVKDSVHEYFGFGPHSACDNKGCNDCDNGWRKHS